MPSARAVLRLTVSVNLVGWSTGRAHQCASKPTEGLSPMARLRWYRSRVGNTYGNLLDDLVRLQQQGSRDGEAERLRGLELMPISNFVGCSTGRSVGLAPRRSRST
jgi:hypothetical protein